MAQRIPRRAAAAAAAGLALACVALTAAPALADQVRNQEWWLSTLHVTKAWQSSRGSGVTVAVLDTGVNRAQADLTGSVRTGPDYTKSGRQAGGPFWGIHGTAVASLIAGHGHGAHNSDGIIGVAPKAKILSVRVSLEGNDPLLSDATIAAGLPAAIARGIRYAVKHGAQVIDLPLDPAFAAATSLTHGSAAPAGGAAAERSAVRYALRKNVVLVAPSGDGGAGTDSVNYPAAYPGVISVGAFNESFTKASFTSRRSYVTLTSAGDGIIAASQPSGYAQLRSTSAASAVVAGMVALIRAQFPTLTPAQVTSALTQSTVFRPPGGRLDGSGFGTADAAAALVAAANINAAVPSGSASGPAAPPAAPAVHVKTESIERALRYPALGVAALLLIALVLLLTGRARRRRARTASLAPLHDAARAASRPHQPETPAAVLPENGARGAPAGGPQRSALGPAPRPTPGRPAKISGTPPWEPASRPEGELPWAAVPPPQPAASRAIQPRRPRQAPGPAWGNAPAGAAWGGGPDSQANGSIPLPAPAVGGYDESAFDDSTDDTEVRPIYVWNPADVTESIPAVPRPNDSGAGKPRHRG